MTARVEAWIIMMALLFAPSKEERFAILSRRPLGRNPHVRRYINKHPQLSFIRDWMMEEMHDGMADDEAFSDRVWERAQEVGPVGFRVGLFGGTWQSLHSPARVGRIKP